MGATLQISVITRIFLIHTSLDFRSEECHDLRNIFVEVRKSYQTSDVDNFDLENRDPVNLVDNSCPHAICNLT